MSHKVDCTICSCDDSDCPQCEGTGIVERDPLDCDCFECCYFASFVCDADATKVERYMNHDIAVARAAVLAERTGKTHSVWHADQFVFTAYSGEELHSKAA